ncbi:uncharacterized protein LOC131936225 [Physella acuta]|uniref:uncharacterized protein LOC131936225 n=1 Tax=Physella acuta TaxID=109671 RepID=UPI0027DADD59|nr:uncharacterized protein LOC131936225 [Physella acuta]
MFSIIVCPDLNVSVNVSAPDVSDNGSLEKQNGSELEPRNMLYLVMASLGVVLLAALLAIVVVRFRRQHSYNRKTCKHKKSKAEMEVLNNLYGLQDIKLYCNNT